MSEKTMRVQDYPLATRCPEHILTPTGKPLTDITLEKVLSGEVGPQDVRISRQTLEYQAQIAEQMPGMDGLQDRKSTRLNSSHSAKSRMPSSA